MTMLAKSVSSTKSEVMMLTPFVPGLWASTQDMMAGRFLESQNTKETHSHKHTHTYTSSITNTLIFSRTSEPPAEQNQEVSVYSMTFPRKCEIRAPPVSLRFFAMAPLSVYSEF